MGQRRQRAFPAPFVPMLATSGPVPTSEGWSFEFKWDGVRGLVAVDPGGHLRATSRNLREITRSYPELRILPTLVNRRVVLDGELVVLDEAGRPSFQLLAHRMHVQNPTAPLLTRLPVQFYVFDLLQVDDQSLLRTPFLERRERLADLDLNQAGLIRTPPHYTDITGPDLLAVAEEQHLEGVIAKRVTSLYYPGKRTQAWVKTPLRNTQEVIIGGWTEGERSRAGTLGALLLAVHDTADNRLRFVGRVGTGFTQAMLRDLQATLKPERERPARSTNPCPARTLEGRTGSNPTWSARSNTGSGPNQTTGSDTPPGAACARTDHPTKSVPASTRSREGVGTW